MLQTRGFMQGERHQHPAVVENTPELDRQSISGLLGASNSAKKCSRESYCQLRSHRTSCSRPLTPSGAHEVLELPDRCLSREMISCWESGIPLLMVVRGNCWLVAQLSYYKLKRHNVNFIGVFTVLLIFFILSSKCTDGRKKVIRRKRLPDPSECQVKYMKGILIEFL